MFRTIKTYAIGAIGATGAALLGSAMFAGTALATDDVIIISNEPIPYVHDRRFAARPMIDIDVMYPSTGGPALILTPGLSERDTGRF